MNLGWARSDQRRSSRRGLSTEGDMEGYGPRQTAISIVTTVRTEAAAPGWSEFGVSLEVSLIGEW